MSIYLGNKLIGNNGYNENDVLNISDDKFIDRTILSYSNSERTLISACAFAACASLVTVDCPSVIGINNSAFYSCTSLLQINFPNCTTISGSAFYNCTALLEVNLPKCETIAGDGFAFCTNLTSVYLPKCKSLYDHAFYACSNLISFNLTGISSIPTLITSGVFTLTPIAGYSSIAGQYGSIYVPASLYSSFLTATNWSYYSSRIVSI